MTTRTVSEDLPTPAAQASLSTHQRALAINLDLATYGAFAEMPSESIRSTGRQWRQ